MALAALIKTARSLDQSGPETTPAKLQRLWDDLAATTADHGCFYASEEVALRWVLKNTSGPADGDGETLRRWPLTWHVLACLFRRIPLFTLAKTLAERRFIAMLQQTVKDLERSSRGKTDGKDKNNDNPRKRKKWQAAPFDLDALRAPEQRLLSAAAVFGALQVLLARLDATTTTVAVSAAGTDGMGALAASHDRIGAEQIRSFFCTPAADAMPLLVPLLRVCSRTLMDAVSKEDTDGDGDGDGDGQAAWLSVVAALWALRLQSPADAPEVAMHLTREGCAMLRRLAESTVPVRAETRRRWTALLQQFLTDHLVLPARAAYLDRQDLTTLQLARDALGSHEALCHELFWLALEAPRAAGGSVSGGSSGNGGKENGPATSRDNAHWLQAVFDVLQAPLHGAAGSTPAAEMSVIARNALLTDLLGLAAAHDVAPSRESLQAIVRHCALAGEASGQPLKMPGSVLGKAGKIGKAERAAAAARRLDHTDWHLVAAAARCDPDAFLVGATGEQLLADVLEDLATAGLPSADQDGSAAAACLVALARGAAAGRSLPAFVTRWSAGLRQSGTAAGGGWTLPNGVQRVYLDMGLRAAVADAVQTALTTQQLRAVLEETCAPVADTDATTAAVCRLVVLDALSAGIYLEEYEDAVGTAMADAVAADLPADVDPQLRAIRWRVVRRTLGWVDATAAEQLWAVMQRSESTTETKEKSKKKEKKDKKDRKDKTKNGTLDAYSFEAFVGTFAFWMALQYCPAEPAARAATWTLFGPVQDALAGLDEAGQTALLQEVARRIAVYDETANRFGGDFASPVAALATYLAWMLCGSSRCIGEMTRSSDAPSALVDTLLPWQAGGGDTDGTGATAVLVASQVLRLSHDKAAGAMTEAYVQQLATEAPGRPAWHEAVRGLLQTPMHLLPRRLRERIAAALLPAASGTPAWTVGDAVLALDLLIRVTRERTVGDMALDRLVWLGQAVEATSATVPLPAARGLLDRYRCVATAAVHHSPPALDGWSAWDRQPSAVLQLILLPAILSGKTAADVVTLALAREKLAALVVDQLRRFLDADAPPTLALLFALDAAAVTATADSDSDSALQMQLDHGIAALAVPITTLADRLDRDHDKMAWQWRTLLAQHLPSDQRPRATVFPGLFDGAVDTVPDTSKDDVAWTAASTVTDGDLLRAYLAAVTRDADRDALLAYMEALVDALPAGPAVAPLLALQHLLGRLLYMPPTERAGFDLGTLHSRLALRLPRAASKDEARLLAQTLRALLLDDRAAAAMGQWNVDTTLSAVAQAVQQSDDQVVFSGACDLVEAVLKRHRLRLEGRFHLLVVALQALLARLLAGKDQTGQSNATNETNETNETGAKRFARLLELVCEPSTAAVATMARRTAGAAPLHSATDAAKRSAGQHMYLVLLAYVKLQIDGAVVARGVRAALEPGLFSILSITSDETRRLLNDAADAGGRALFRELYRRWLQFGKWKGV